MRIAFGIFLGCVIAAITTAAVTHTVDHHPWILRKFSTISEDEFLLIVTLVYSALLIFMMGQTVVIAMLGK